MASESLVKAVKLLLHKWSHSILAIYGCWRVQLDLLEDICEHHPQTQVIKVGVMGRVAWKFLDGELLSNKYVYGKLTISYKTLLSQSSGAFIEAMNAEIKDLLKEMKDKLNSSLYEPLSINSATKGGVMPNIYANLCAIDCTNLASMDTTQLTEWNVTNLPTQTTTFQEETHNG